MKNTLVFKVTLILSIPVTIIGALFKLMHWPGASMMLLIGLLMSLTYIVAGLYIILTDTSRTPLSKLLWVFGFLLLSLIAGIIFWAVEIPKYERRRRTDLGL